MGHRLAELLGPQMVVHSADPTALHWDTSLVPLTGELMGMRSGCRRAAPMVRRMDVRLVDEMGLQWVQRSVVSAVHLVAWLAVHWARPMDNQMVCLTAALWAARWAS